jgi:FAD/FMN-containing dehydrogenase
MPHPQGVVLSLAKMKKILHVDPVARVAVVQPGVRNLAISEAVAPLGLYYAPDPSSSRSPARSAATSPRTRAACIASNTA